MIEVVYVAITGVDADANMIYIACASSTACVAFTIYIAMCTWCYFEQYSTCLDGQLRL